MSLFFCFPFGDSSSNGRIADAYAVLHEYENEVVILRGPVSVVSQGGVGKEDVAMWVVHELKARSEWRGC